METTIGIIGAMDEEIELHLESMSDVMEYGRAGITFYKGRRKSVV